MASVSSATLSRRTSGAATGRRSWWQWFRASLLVWLTVSVSFGAVASDARAVPATSAAADEALPLDPEARWVSKAALVVAAVALVVAVVGTAEAVKEAHEDDCKVDVKGSLGGSDCGPWSDEQGDQGDESATISIDHSNGCGSSHASAYASDSDPAYLSPFALAAANRPMNSGTNVATAWARAEVKGKYKIAQDSASMRAVADTTDLLVSFEVDSLVTYMGSARDTCRVSLWLSVGGVTQSLGDLTMLDPDGIPGSPSITLEGALAGQTYTQIGPDEFGGMWVYVDAFTVDAAVPVEIGSTVDIAAGIQPEAVSVATSDGGDILIPITDLNTPDHEIEPTNVFDLETGAHTMYFATNRPGGEGGFDIWTSTSWTGDTWEPPHALPGNVNSPWNESGPEVTGDGNWLIFDSMNPAGQGEADLYRAPLDDLAAVQPLAFINTPFDERDAATALNGQLLVFASDRPGGFGGHDLWMSGFDGFRVIEPINLGPAINSADDEWSPWLTEDGLQLMYTSNRGEGLGRDDIWLSVRTSTSSGTWAKSVHMAEPVNSPLFDSGAEHTGPFDIYFATNRYGSGYDLVWARVEDDPTVGVELPPDVDGPSSAMDLLVPSPFHARSALSLTLASRADVRVDIFDISGRRVARIADEPLAAGRHRVVWDGRDRSGRHVADGVYFVRVGSGSDVAMSRMVYQTR